TWGVLDRLLEEASFRFEGVSGSSAGAVNAVVLASGWLEGGATGARQALRDLWHDVAALSSMSPLRAAGVSQLAADFATQLLSPYQLNPLGLNPLRAILERLVDFERLRRERTIRIFVAATNLRTSTARIFENPELSNDAVLASACLPQLHRAVEIDGDAYWDGGFVTNPPLLPLVERCRARDLLLIRINPLEVLELPRTARQIRNRIGEIVFGRPLATELEQLAAAARSARFPLAWIDRRSHRLARHRLHLIDGAAELGRLDPGTKTDPDWRTLQNLHDLGRVAADAWLRQVLDGSGGLAANRYFARSRATWRIAASKWSSA
ncbi:MAG: patatin-like phospholipase family protein, partial [Geminicoccaceae bacterium]